MKRLLSALALILSIGLLPLPAAAKDRKKDNDYEAWKKYTKAARDDVREVEKLYAQVRDRVKNLGGGRHQWEHLQQIDQEIDRLNWQFNHANVDPRQVRGRCEQLKSELRNVQNELEHQNSRRGGYYRYR